jgi:hypothetical protein
MTEDKIGYQIGTGIEALEVYKEGCSAFRHYSSAALNIRLSSIAQGVVMMTAVGFLIKEDSLEFAQYASGFGLLFTVALMFLHENYQRKCSLFIAATSLIEICPDVIDQHFGCMDEMVRRWKSLAKNSAQR